MSVLYFEKKKENTFCLNLKTKQSKIAKKHVTKIKKKELIKKKDKIPKIKGYISLTFVFFSESNLIKKNMKANK